MTNLNISSFRYFGFDESPIGGNSVGLVLSCTETRDERLVQQHSFLNKAADYLQLIRKGHTACAPSLQDMYRNGLDHYSWIRSNQGRSFCRQRAAHASIAELLIASRVDPQEMVVYIDEFFPPERTQELLQDYLQRHYQFDLPRANIHVIADADRTVPLVNFADILAYRIAANFRAQQNGFSSPGKKIPARDLFDEPLVSKDSRVSTLPEDGRVVLAELLSA